MDKRTALLLAEAKVYKEEIRRSQFMLSQFCERLKLTENEELILHAEDILAGLQAFEKIGTLLENAAAELEKEPAEEIIENIPVAEEAPVVEEAPVLAAQEVIEEASVFAAAQEVIEEAPVFASVQEIAEDLPVFEAVSEVREEAPVFGFAEAFSEDAFSAEPVKEAVNPTPVFEAAEEIQYSAPVFTPVEEVRQASPVFTPVDDIMQRFVEEEPEVKSAAPVIPDEDNVMRCENCGTIVKENYAFCSVCGTKIKNAEEKPVVSEKSFSDFLAHEPALSQRVFPDFNDVAEADVFDEKDFMPGVNDGSVKEPVASNARPAAFLVNHRDNSVIPILKDEFLIGRDPTKTDYCISDNSAISRVHAKIYYADGQYLVCDCNSVNGTYINETRIMPEDFFVLFNGSEIRLNTERFTFRIS